MIEEGYQFSHFLMGEDYHKKMDKTSKRLVKSMRSLCKEIPSEFILLSKEGIGNEKERQTHGHPNVRILNRAEPVSLLDDQSCFRRDGLCNCASSSSLPALSARGTFSRIFRSRNSQWLSKI